MASAGIKIPFVADVGSFLQGTKSMTSSLDDVSDSLDELGQDAAKAQRTSQRAFSSIGVDADQAAEKVERSFKDSFDDIPKAAKVAGAKTSRALDDSVGSAAGGKKAKFAEFGNDLGGELGQNIGEGISSKAVGISGALDTTLGTIGGVLPALGPAGAIAGVGALVISSIIGGISAAAEAKRQQVKDIGAAMFDALNDGIVDRTEQTDIVTKALGQENWTDALAIIRQQSEDTGVSVKSLFDAYAHGTDVVGVDLDAVIAKHTTMTSVITAGRSYTVPVLDATAKAAQGVKDQLQASADAAALTTDNINTQAAAFGTLDKAAQAYYRTVAAGQSAAIQTLGIVGGRKLVP